MSVERGGQMIQIRAGAVELKPGFLVRTGDLIAEPWEMIPGT